MAITSLAGVIAGMQPPVNFVKITGPTQVIGRLFSPYYTAGYPGAAAVPTPGVAGEVLTSGQAPFVNGASDQYLARFASYCNVVGTTMLCDRLWHNSGLSMTSTSAQTVDSVAWPARDHNASTNGDGVLVGVEVSTITGAGVGGALEIGYTNQSGTAGRIGRVRVNAAATMAVGVFLDFTLDAGDTGVRSIQTYTNPATLTSGEIHLVAYRVLARASNAVALSEGVVDALTAGMTKLHDDTVLTLLFFPSATNGPSLSSTQFVQTNG